MKILSTISLLALSSFIATATLASDHIDGPVTTGHRVADLSDLYAFPTPQKPGHLTVILNAYPIVPASGHFADKVNYNLYFRKANISGTGDSSLFQTSEETVIGCSFKTPDNTEDHTITCKSSNGLSVQNKYESAEAGSSNDFRLYSGMRSDPFFFYAEWATAASTKGKLLPPKDDDVMADINVLTIVLEIEVAKLFKTPGTLFAVAAESTTQDSSTAPVRRLDRLGRPEITNVSLVSHGQDPELRDVYNLDQPFQVAAANRQTYQERLAKNILFYDALDTKKNWQDSDRQHLANLLADDFLVVDISKPCETPTFFEIEKSLLLNKSHETCGGRKPNDDIMDVLFSLYIGGPSGERIRDGVDHPSHTVKEVFPYLA